MQSKTESLVEATLNTASGFIVSLLVSWAIYPLYGFKPSFGQLTSITVIFTVVSILRSFLWRRYFNHRIIKKGEATP